MLYFVQHRRLYLYKMVFYPAAIHYSYLHIHVSTVTQFRTNGSMIHYQHKLPAQSEPKATMFHY